MLLTMVRWDSEMLKIYRDWFGKSFSTVVFIGNIEVTVPHARLFYFV